MSITPRDFNKYTKSLVEMYVELENELIMQIARRLKRNNYDNITQWQISMLNQTKSVHKSTVSRISRLSGVSKQKINKLFKTAGIDIQSGIDNEMYSLIGTTKSNSSYLNQIVQSYANQTFLDLDNFVNQTLISTNYSNNAIAKMYEQIINEIALKVTTGTMSFDKAIFNTIKQWQDKGVSSLFIDKGGHKWSLERYVRTVLNSTLSRTFDDMRLFRMLEFGVDLVLCSSKADARPVCSLCQGTVMTTRPRGYKGYRSIYEFGYGTPAGLRGINCMHMLFPYIEGANTNNMVQYDSKGAVNRFKQIQKQRGYESRIRKSKHNLSLAEELGNQKEIERYKKQIRRQQFQIRQYIKENNLSRDYSREKII